MPLCPYRNDHTALCSLISSSFKKGKFTCTTVKTRVLLFKESGMMNQGTEILSPATYLQKASWLFEESKTTKWTPEENKRFENALALFDKDTPDRWNKVAAILPVKTVNDVIKRYNELVEDVSDIEAGLIPISGDTSCSFTLEQMKNNHGYHGLEQFFIPDGKQRLSARSSDPARKKGAPWTEEEHRQFLLGLQKYGKGDWRNISRNFVTTRTPTQVASHAQKYFIRQLSGAKDKRRSSIHDITAANVTETTSPSPEKQRPLSPDKSTRVMQQQNHSNINSVANVLCYYTLQSNGPDTSFETQNNYLNKTYLQRPPALGTRLPEHNLHSFTSDGLQLGQHNMFPQLQSTLHQ